MDLLQFPFKSNSFYFSRKLENKIYFFFCRFPITAILLQVTLPTDSQLHYSCDYLYDTTCAIEGIVNLSFWEYEISYGIEEEPIIELKFDGCKFVELSTTISINYDDYLGYNSLNVVNLSGNRIRTFSKFHFTIDTLLVANLSRNEIENLETQSIFDAHPTLLKIDLSFNEIASIHSEAFNGLTKLEELFLNGNKLKEIHEFVFAPLVQLKCLELSANEIERFDNNSFGELINLQQLKLQKNNFTEFNFDILKSNDLRDIELGNNGDNFLSLTGHVTLAASVKFSQISQSNFTAISKSVSITNSKISILSIENVVENIVAMNSSITQLIFNIKSDMWLGDFSNNLLTGHLSFDDSQKLEILDVAHNHIQSISFVNCSMLTKVNLSHNNLTFIQNMTSLSNMKILDLFFNCISNFEINSFSSMTSLEVLNLRQTCFKSLDYGTFSYQNKLRVLDISFNNLHSIDLMLLSTQVSLEDLFIDGNNLTDVQSMDLIGNHFPKLKSIGLTHNKWSCKTLSSILSKLYRLKIEIFVEDAIKHTTNVKGIGCTSTQFNSTHETLLIPKSPMSLNHTMYMSKIEQINEIVKNVNELKDNKNYREMLDNEIKQDIADLQNDKTAMKSKIDDQINQLKIFGKEIVNKFKLLHEINFNKLMKMKETIEKLNETNNDKYELMYDSINSLKDKLKSIQLNKEDNPENVTEITSDKIKANYGYFDDVSTLNTLEMCLIVLVFVLLIVALYYAVVYC